MAKTSTPSSKPPSSEVRTRKVSVGKRPESISFPNYHAALKYLYDRADVERMRPSRVDPSVFKLDRMQGIVSALGNPHESLKCVHIAGTNGKGSTVAMTASCLKACGYTVGTYTSPHLVDLRERIMINGSMIAYPHFTELMGRVATAAAGLPKKWGEPTFFELMTALAFLHFAEQAVDAAVIEVGLGGRLDSTNVITPEVSAITSISFDHMQFLGKTLPAIAEQKAGIFKKGVPALTIPQEPSVIDAMRRVAEQVGAPFEVLGQDIEFSYRFEGNSQLGPLMRVGMSTERCEFEHIPVPLPGEHQAYNCGLTLAIVDKLCARGFELPENRVMEGLEKVQLPGRMEIAWKEPRILLDGAHNPAALAALIKSVGAHVQKCDSMIMIFGCAADKDLDNLLKKVALGADKVIFTRAKNNARAAEPADLARRFSEITPKMCQVAPTLEEALSIAGRAAGRDDLICITGSFYLVGEAKKLLADRANKSGSASGALAVV